MNRDSLETILAPISEDAPCGSDLEYDPAFTALETSARPKAEQQFGDSVIPEVPPDWRAVSAQALELLQRTKDVRVAILALRAATRLHGITGFALGLEFLHELFDRYWDTLHPQLDADDDNDPTMRLNALAPMTDADMVLRDLHEALIGSSRSTGPIHVRDVELALGKLTPKDGESVFSAGQIGGALAEVFETDADIKTACASAASWVAKLQTLVNGRVGGQGMIDLKPLQSIAYAVQQLAKEADPGASQDDAGDPSGTSSGGDAQQGARGGRSGEIATRQDAVETLDKVIRFLEKTEPGNPAPLLIKRAQRLIGVSFLDIMSDLAPDALGTIENITGRTS